MLKCLKFPESKKVILAVLGVFLAAALIRFVGLGWGLPSDEIPHYPFHPDESWAMDVLSTINWETLSLNPPDAHREGTMSFYMVSAFLTFLKTLKVIQVLPHEVRTYSSQYGEMIYFGRFLVAALDLLSGFILFNAFRLIGRSWHVPLLGASVFLFFPFEAIHAHFMRSHNLVNFFLTFVIYFSIKYWKTESLRFLFFSGFFAGFATATKYPSGLSILIPFIVFCEKTLEPGKLHWKTFVNKRFFKTNLGLLLTLFLGFFLSDPYLFIHYSSASPALNHGLSYAAQQEFSFAEFFNLKKIFVYLVHLVPIGSLPFLWLLIYTSLVYCIWRIRQIRIASAAILAGFFYLFFVSKGYLDDPIFARPYLFLIPLFSVVVFFALEDFVTKFRSTKIQSVAFCASWIVVAFSFLYSLSYVLAMAKEDSRIELFHFLNAEFYTTNSAVNVGIYHDNANYFIATPTIDILATQKKVVLKTIPKYKIPSNEVQFIVLRSFNPLAGQKTEKFVSVEQQAANLVEKGEFEIVRKFETELHFFGKFFNVENYPLDMQYPFVRIWVLKRISI